MAFDFPSSPSDGQVFTPSGGPTYTYNAAGTKWLVSPLSSSVTITSGTFTPSVIGVNNVSATTAFTCPYLRVGDRVIVSGYVEADAVLAASALTMFNFSLPIASSLTADNQCGGAGQGLNSPETTAIRGDPVNDAAQFVYQSQNTTNLGFHFIFHYQVL